MIEKGFHKRLSVVCPQDPKGRFYPVSYSSKTTPENFFLDYPWGARDKL
jgi:hypothetical protein